MEESKFIVYLLALSVSTALVADTADTVRWQGSLRAVHGGDVSGHVSLQQFAAKPNLYAVGPAAELDGEITVIAGKFYIARVKHDKLKTDSNLEAHASFLVWSEVAAWKPPVLLGVKANTHAQLEKQIEALAIQSGIDITKPFPFKLEGVLSSVDYHVLVPKTHPQQVAGHQDIAMKISAKNTDAEVIGFFSKNHEGVFTHKGSVAHLHVVERNGNSGHVDEISVSAEGRVFLPQ